MCFTWCIMRGALYNMHDSWHIAHRTWSIEHGTKCKVYGAEGMVHGAWKMVDSTRWTAQSATYMLYDVLYTVHATC